MEVEPSLNSLDSAGVQSANQSSSDAQISAYREQGSLWSWTRDPESVPGFRPNERTIHGLECFQYTSPTVDPVVSKVELDESRLRNWLDAKLPSKNEEQPCGGYKILQFDADTMGEVPMKSDDYQAINEAFRLPPIALHLATEKQGAYGMFLQDDDSVVFVHRPPWIRQYMTTVLRYDPATNMTSGYIFTDVDDDDKLGFLDYMHHQFLTCPHPLLLPTLTDELALEKQVQDIVQKAQILDNLEFETGFSGSKWTGRVAVSKISDYHDLVRRVGEEQSWFLENATALTVSKLAIESHLKHLKRLETTLPEETLRLLRRPSIQLNDRLEYILSSVEHALVHGNIEYRYKSLQTVLFNLIAQADNEINIDLSKDSRELAAASKQDSSAMKIIAFLTTLFLPGTFIATIFAMPLFNWETPSIS